MCKKEPSEKRDEVSALAETLRAFVKKRKHWHHHHAPKNLSMALSVEVAELMEIFQWLSVKESWQLSDKRREALDEEIGDVMIYLTMLADKFQIDPCKAAYRKIEKNQRKYPPDEAV
ncbi:nucleotide pyrophosphohydrolase [Magnetococcales bacterium HHB-1]